jgi:hypothetical protein
VRRTAEAVCRSAEPGLARCKVPVLRRITRKERVLQRARDTISEVISRKRYEDLVNSGRRAAANPE